MRVGKSSFIIRGVYCHHHSVIVGSIEMGGPLKHYYDKCINDVYFGEKSFEKAEVKMFNEGLKLCLEKNKLCCDEVDAIVYSDLNNQIAIGSYCLKNFNVPAMGIYSACSGFTEGVIIASSFIELGFENIIVSMSSHNGTSERQFRYPIEYGGKKELTTTYTVTSSNHLLVSSKISDISVSRITIGNIGCNNLKNPNDMGRAMAIACYETFKRHFNDFNISPSEYDLILSGDLSKYGSELFLKYLEEDGISLDNYNDTGLMIYDSKQRVFAGGSGIGCVSSVVLAYVFSLLKEKKLNKVLVIATGALLNPVMTLQKETIPSVAHAVCFERNNE